MLSKKKILILIIIMFFAVFSTVEIQAQEYDWMMGWNTGAEVTNRGVAAQVFTEFIENESDGRVSISHYPDEILGSEQEMIEMMQIGALDIQLIGAGALSPHAPEFAVGNLPFFFDSYEEAHAVFDGYAGDALKKHAEDVGIKILAFSELGFADITNNVRPIEHPDDFEGIAMRSPEETQLIQTFRSMGASVSTLPFTEVYLGLDQGVVDGQFNPLPSIYDANFHEVQDYLTDANIFYYWVNIAINKNLWDSLDAEMQELVEQAAIKGSEASREHHINKEIEAWERAEDDFVVSRPDLDPFREETASVYDYIREELVGDELIDLFIQAVEEYRGQ